MRIRQGFISNSSSSSFVIAKSYMTEEQIKEFRDHINNISKLDEDGCEKSFYYDEDKNYFSGDGDNYWDDDWEVKLKELNLWDKTYMGEG